jgi:hypothetical protein
MNCVQGISYIYYYTRSSENLDFINTLFATGRLRPSEAQLLSVELYDYCWTEGVSKERSWFNRGISRYLPGGTEEHHGRISIGIACVSGEIRNNALANTNLHQPTLWAPWKCMIPAQMKVCRMQRVRAVKPWVLCRKKQVSYRGPAWALVSLLVPFPLEQCPLVKRNPQSEFSCEVWGSHGDEYGDGCLMNKTASDVSKVPRFRRKGLLFTAVSVATTYVNMNWGIF